MEFLVNSQENVKPEYFFVFFCFFRCRKRSLLIFYQSTLYHSELKVKIQKNS